MATNYSFVSQFSSVETLAQYYMFMPPRVKDSYLVYLLRNFVENNPKDQVQQ